MTRTYGTYAYLPTGLSGHASIPMSDRGKPMWSLSLQPAVAIRAKRLFARARSTTVGTVTVGATPEVAHDLEWFMQRFPLLPADDRTEQTLVAHSAEHAQLEEQVGSILAGTHHAQPLTLEPARPARDYQRAAVDLLRTTRQLDRFRLLPLW